MNWFTTVNFREKCAPVVSLRHGAGKTASVAESPFTKWTKTYGFWSKPIKALKQKTVGVLKLLLIVAHILLLSPISTAFTADADGTVGITIIGDAWECDSTGRCCLASDSTACQ